MKNNIFRFILSMALAFVAVPMVAQDFLTVFFKDGIQRKFYLEGVTEIATSQYDAEGVQHTEYAYQHIVTRNKTYIYVLEDIDSITFTKYCEEEVKQAFSSALSVAFPSLSPCETIEDAEQKIDILKNADGVEEAWREGDDIYIKIKNWETISFHFHSYNKEQDNKELIRSLDSLKQVIPQLIPQLRSGDGQGRMPSVVVANQMHYDKNRSDQKELLEALCKQLRDFGIVAHYEQDPKIEFFDTEMYKYDIVVLMTHGNYSNGQHSFVTVEELGDKSFKINLLDNSLAEDADYNKPSEEVKEAWRKAFNDLVDKKKYQGSSTVTLNYNKEFRGSVWPYYPYWIAHPQINEDFFEERENGGLSEGKFRPNSIFFNGACHSMNGKDDAWHSLADKLIDNHGLSLYFGYENENYNSHEAACIFLRSMYNGMSTNNAFYSIPDYYRMEPEGAVLKFWPKIGTADIFLFQTHTNQVDQTKAKNDFKNSKYVEVEGLATILDRDKSETLNAITYGFVYGTDERIASDEHISSKLTYGTYISSTDKKALSSTIDKGNVLFKARLTKIDPEKTYYYRAYTYDGIYYNYGNPCSFIINPPIRLNDGESFIVDDVAYTVRSKEERTCQVGYVTNTVKPSARKRVGSIIVPAILPDREGELSIPEEAGYLSVIAVGDYSFYDCGKVTAINLPETIEEIGESAMSGCIGLSSITIPKNVKTISRNAFGGCKNVKSIYAEMTTPFSIAENVFQTASEEQAGTASTIFANATLYVPVGSKNQYATTPGWNKFQRIDEYTSGGETPDPGPGGDITAYTSCPDDHHPHLIDLGLPSGAKMACSNEGAAKPEETGDAYTWDEAMSLCQNKGYRLLTEDEIRELVLNCGHELMTINGVKGQKIKASNGNVVFLPLGDYWSCDVNADGNPYFMYVKEDVVQWASVEKNEKKLVRPVYTTGGETPGPGGDIIAYTSCPDDHHPHLIDLGLPSGTKWACCNVGASKPEDYGGYYAWGETETIDHTDGWNYLGGKGEDYFIGNDISGTEYDVAHVKWGSSWVMPSQSDMDELIDYTRYECASINDVKGLLIRGDNGGSLFLPAAGTSSGEDIVNNGDFGDYWLANLWTPIPEYTNEACQIHFYFEPSTYLDYTYHVYRVRGHPIRPVFKSSKPNPNVNDDSIITFVDPKVKAICVANWDTNGDGELSKKEAAAVTDLRRVFEENKEITSFDELRFFTGLKKLDNYAFYACKSLACISIPNSVTLINGFAFRYCNSLTTITIPNSVTEIGEYAFSDCTSLTNITIPNSVSEIGPSVFRGCKNVTSVSISNSLTELSDDMFAGCKSLTSIVIPNSVSIISYSAFSGCINLASIILPNSITIIDLDAFMGCENLKEVISYIENPFVLEFPIGYAYQATLYVPAGTKARYEATEGWKNFKNIVEME